MTMSSCLMAVFGPSMRPAIRPTAGGPGSGRHPEGGPQKKKGFDKNDPDTWGAPKNVTAAANAAAEGIDTKNGFFVVEEMHYLGLSHELNLGKDPSADIDRYHELHDAIGAEGETKETKAVKEKVSEEYGKNGDEEKAEAANKKISRKERENEAGAKRELRGLTKEYNSYLPKIKEWYAKTADKYSKV